MKVLLANPRGFCAGVRRAISIVERAVELYSDKYPIYVVHEIVHNKYVVDTLRAKGVVFVETIYEVPDNVVVIFSAHGVSSKVENYARSKGLRVIDATCSIVTKVHKEAQFYEKNNIEIILIGHAGHPEVVGITGRVKSEVILIESLDDVNKIQVKNPDNLAYITQTTLSVDDTRDIINALKLRFPNIRGRELSDICYATQNRQDAIKQLVELVDLVLVIGAQNSSNSNRLYNIPKKFGIPSYLINRYTDINEQWFINANSLGITAGASAPEILVEEIIDYLDTLFPIQVETIGDVQENIKFKLPSCLV